MNVSILAPAASVASAVGDPGRTRLVLGAIVALIAIGVVLAGAAVWLYRTTRHDHPVLAPLELMGDRSWRRAEPSSRRSLLDEHRPPGARPLADPFPEPADEAVAEPSSEPAEDGELEPSSEPADDGELESADATAGIGAPPGTVPAENGDEPAGQGNEPSERGAEPAENVEVDESVEDRGEPDDREQVDAESESR